MNQKRSAICLLFGFTLLVSTAPTVAAQAAKVYDVGGTPLIEHGDTLKMLLTPAQKQTLKARLDSTARSKGEPAVQSVFDTLTVLVRTDSGFVLLSGRRYPMDARLAAHFRNLREVARREAAHPLTRPIVVQ